MLHLATKKMLYIHTCSWSGELKVFELERRVTSNYISGRALKCIRRGIQTITKALQTCQSESGHRFMIFLKLTAIRGEKNNKDFSLTNCRGASGRIKPFISVSFKSGRARVKHGLSTRFHGQLGQCRYKMDTIRRDPRANYQ